MHDVALQGLPVRFAIDRAGLLDRGPAVRTMTLPDKFIDHGTPAEMYAEAGLTAQDIADTALRALGVATLARQRA